MAAPDATTCFYAKDRKAWCKWLQQNGEKKNFVWLILYRKSSKTPSVYYGEAVEEALCFGWIDSKPNKRDAESYYLFFARRKPKSVWSKINKERAKRLAAQGLMTEKGQAMIDTAKQNGSWDALNSVDALEHPAELKKAFAKNKIARKYFEAFPPSAKKGILQWINGAKTEATKNKRIAETISLAEKNERAAQYKPKTK